MVRHRNSPTFKTLSNGDQEHVVRMVKSGTTRRDFIGWMAALGASAAAAGSIFADARYAWANTPKKGGKLTFAFNQHGPADTLDPALFQSTLAYIRGRSLYGSLVRLTSELSYEPELAEKIIPNADLTEWTFMLKKGVEFHNGKTMTADDVVYSMNRHIGKDSISKASALVNMVDRWEKVNNHEVRAVLSSPNADLPIALGTFHFKIVPDGHTDFSNPIGTGPFRNKEFKPGVRHVVTAFENYWEDGPNLDEFETFGISDSVSRVSALLAGDIDGAQAIPPKTIATIEDAAGHDMWTVPSGAYINIAARVDMQPSGNPDLLLAIKYLMDRERILKGVLKGQGALGNDQPIGPAYFDHCPDIPQRQFDLDKAKYHFHKSGVGNTPIPIVAAEVGPGTVDQTLILQREAAKIGLNIQVQKVTTDGYWASVWLKVPMCVVRWNARPTANIMLSLAFHSEAKWNESYWKNEQFDQLLVAVRGVSDAAKRKQMYCDMQTMIHETGGTILSAHLNYMDAVGSYVKGRTAVPLANFGGCESPAYMWRDDV